MKRSAIVFLVLLTFACSHTTPQPAVQPAPGGTIQGQVLLDGAPLPGVTVTIAADGRLTRSAHSDVNGHYAFLRLEPGVYTVTYALESLQPLTRKVTVTGAEGVTLTTAMRLNAVAESITVTAAAPTMGSFGALPKRQRTSAPVLTSPAVYQLPASPSYAPIKERGFIETKEEHVATFAIDVDRASYANLRRHVNDGMLPPPDAIRIEEMVNYFTYDYPQPKDDAPFSVTTEVAGCPWNPKHRLLRVGVQGRNLDQWRMAPNNLVFLIDVSGSMQEPRKLPLLKDAFKVLVDELRAEDRISIVVYAGSAGLVLPATSGADKDTINAAIRKLEAGGSTAGGAGIELAYKVAKEQFMEQGNNRVILATDGDFNVGVSSTDELQKLIEEKRDSGIFLSVLGVGAHIFNDAGMETLADKGNGNYSYLDSLQEAEKVFRHELTGTLVTIAKDVKVQLEFDPSVVTSYRQIGYENRALNAKDFEDDKKDAGELGAGHSVTALFEIATTRSGRIGELRLRYKDPRGATSTAIEAALVDEGKGVFDASPDLQFAAAVAELGMLLRDSPHKGDATFDEVLRLARVSTGVDLDGRRQEFVQLAEKVKERR